jgi:hypothetical protein
MDFTTIHSFSLELAKIAESKSEKALFERVKRESPVKVLVTEEAKMFGGGYYDTGEGEHIGVSDKRFDTLAHEVGHAKNHQKIWGKFIQSVPARLAFQLAPAAGLAAGMALAKGRKWPLIIPAAAVAPILLAEALATNTGHKVLKKVKAKPEEVEKYRRNLRTAFSTYLQTPIAAGAAGTLSYLLHKATLP